MAFSMKSLKRTFSQNRTTHDANDVLDKITVHIYIDVLEPKENGIRLFDPNMSAEDVCLKIATDMNIGSKAFPLFGLRDVNNTKIWLPPNDEIGCNKDYKEYCFRCRFKPSNEKINTLVREESEAMFYYFLQCRHDFVAGFYKMDEALSNGLGLLDILRVMHKEQIADVGIFFSKYKLKYFLPSNSFKPYDNNIAKVLRHKKQFEKHVAKELKKKTPDGSLYRERICERYVKMGLWSDPEVVKFFETETFTPREGALLVTPRGLSWEQSGKSRNKYSNRPECEMEEINFVSLRDAVYYTINSESGEPGIQVSISAKEQLVYTFNDEIEARSFVSSIYGYRRLTVDFSSLICEQIYSPQRKELVKLHIIGPAQEKYILQQLRWKHKRNSDYNYVITQDPKSVQNFMIYVLDESASALNSFHVIYENEIYTIYNNGNIMGDTFSRIDHLIKYHKTNKDILKFGENAQVKDDPELFLCSDRSTKDIPQNENTSKIASARVVSKIEINHNEPPRHGEFTTVYHGTYVDEDTLKMPEERSTAVKEIKPSGYPHLQTLLDGVHQLAFWKHTNIVRLYELSLKMPLSISMELADMGNISDVRKKYTVSKIILLSVAEQIAQALSYLRKLGTEHVHGNIRCRNVLVFKYTTGNIQVKLGDPGIRSTHDINSKVWLAFECLDNNSQHLTHQTDIYAYGMMVAELFNKEFTHPFIQKVEQDNVTLNVQIIKKFVEQLQKSQSIIFDDVPRNVYDMIKSCTTLDPTSRWEPQLCVQKLLQLVSILSDDANDSDDSSCDRYSNLDDSDDGYSTVAFTTGLALLTIEDPDRKPIISDTVLGKGNFGIVRKGTYDNQDVAIKTVSKDKSQEAVVAMQKELDVMVKLKHDRIVKLLSYSKKKKNMWLVMELMHESLIDYLRSIKDVHPLPAKLERISKEICQGMKYLASEKIIHRDLAARNVLLTESHNAKVADFGLARAIMDDDYYHQSNTQCSLPIFWYPPEALIVTGKKQKFTLAADVWSYGVTLWEIYTYGEKPDEHTTCGSFRELPKYFEKGLRFTFKSSIMVDDKMKKLIEKDAWEYDYKKRKSFDKIYSEYFS